jgi:hypothetical protein
MSAATAARPLVRPAVDSPAAPLREVHPRHIEIVTTRAQRRARPKVLHAVVVLGALFGIFIAQLLLSIAVSDGAYQIAGLQQSQKELSRTEAALAEDLAVLGSTQHLVANAASLGMVIATNPAYLRLADGAAFAAPPALIRDGCATTCGTATNELTAGLPLITPQPSTASGAAAPGTTVTGPRAGQSIAPATPSGPTTEPMPAPVTQ